MWEKKSVFIPWNQFHEFKKVYFFLYFPWIQFDEFFQNILIFFVKMISQLFLFILGIWRRSNQAVFPTSHGNPPQDIDQVSSDAATSAGNRIPSALDLALPGPEF